MKTIIYKWEKLNLILKVLIGIIIGAILGVVFPKASAIGILGTLFIGTLKAVAPILVFAVVMSSIAKAGQGIGKRFRNVIFLYLFSSLLSAIIAVFVCYAFPVTVSLNGADVSESAPQSLGAVLSGLLENVVANPVKSLSDGNYLGILFWAVIIGLGLKIVADDTTKNVLNNLSDALSKVVGWVIGCAPFGILGIVYSSVSENGLSIFTFYGKLILVLVLTILFVMLVSNPLIIFFCTKKNPYPLVFKCIRKSAVPAFFTRSSAANIPINMKLCEELGLDRDFYSVSIPLGSTINMNGAAIVITVMSLTLAHTIGINVPLPTALLLAVVSTIGACGTSGVAGGSLLLIPMSCSVLGIPSEISMEIVAVGFIISVVQDSMETALNSSADVEFTAAAEMMK